MAKQEPIKKTGKITEVKRTEYEVLLENGHKVTCQTSGKMKKFRIILLEGDKVDVEMTPYDLSKGRIVFRHSTYNGKNTTKQSTHKKRK